MYVWSHRPVLLPRRFAPESRSGGRAGGRPPFPPRRTLSRRAASSVPEGGHPSRRAAPFPGRPRRDRELCGFFGWDRMTFAVAWVCRMESRDAWADRMAFAVAWAIFPRKGESRPAPPTQRGIPPDAGRFSHASENHVRFRPRNCESRPAPPTQLRIPSGAPCGVG